MNTHSLIQEFFNHNRFAMIGVSRNPKDFSRMLFKEFITRGYDVLPVNPLAREIEHKQCYSSVTGIAPAVSSALLMTSPSDTESLIEECAVSGITLVWLYGISGMKDVNPNTVAYCQNHGIQVIPGYCPFMFLPSAPWYHRVHGAVWKLLGKYPQ